MSYFKTCPHCGAALDPGERCECLRVPEPKSATGKKKTKKKQLPHQNHSLVVAQQ